MTRGLRIMLVANDGFSAGHVARTLAIARGLARRAGQRGIELRALLVTTSEAHDLLAGEATAPEGARLVIVRLPAPVAARHAGFSDAERRRLVRATVDGLVEGFGPDLVVADTFPSGPHGELAGIGRRAKRAVVRRSVPDERADTLTAGLGDHDLAIVTDDPRAIDARLPIPTVRVPPITIAEASAGLDRAEARRVLGLPASGRAILVAAGGGGDGDAAARASATAGAIARIAPDAHVVLALGPLARATAARVPLGVAVTRIAPLQPVLAAFDGAFSPAGYNTAHELAKARVPAALFAQPRPFDDQAGRAARFANAGFAWVLARFDDAAIAEALAWLGSTTCPELEAGGADRAADALLELATGGLAG